MSASTEYLSPAAAARRLGVSPKALRIYEERGLIAPLRTVAGWRAYGPDQMSRAAEIATLRAYGLSLAQVARVLDGDAVDLEPALGAHQAGLERQARELVATAERVRALRMAISQGQVPKTPELARLIQPSATLIAALDLPWPWGGERFEFRDLKPLTYVIGPLGSGKTRLIERLAETLPNAAFLEFGRLEDEGAAALARQAADPALKARVDQTLAWLMDDGAKASGALSTLVTGLETEGPDILVIDMLEQGLDRSTQAAVAALLRRRGPLDRPLIFTTRSSVILDLAAVGAEAAIIFCPPNHSPPMRIAPYPGAPGHEAVASCLATPEVRARTEGVRASRPFAAGTA